MSFVFDFVYEFDLWANIIYSFMSISVFTSDGIKHIRWWFPNLTTYTSILFWSILLIFSRFRIQWQTVKNSWKRNYPRCYVWCYTVFSVNKLRISCVLFFDWWKTCIYSVWKYWKRSARLINIETKWNKTYHRISTVP